MAKSRTTTVEQQLREAIEADQRALYRIADDAGVPRSTLQEWWGDPSRSIGLHHVSRLCTTLGLELRSK